MMLAACVMSAAHQIVRQLSEDQEFFFKPSRGQWQRKLSMPRVVLRSSQAHLHPATGRAMGGHDLTGRRKAPGPEGVNNQTARCSRRCRKPRRSKVTRNNRTVISVGQAPAIFAGLNQDEGLAGFFHTKSESWGAKARFWLCENQPSAPAPQQWATGQPPRFEAVPDHT